MKEILDISIIIPTRNRLQSLRQTISSACAGSGIPKQIIVVDQSDTPIQYYELADIVPDSTELRVAFRKEPSITAARNLGIRMATCAIILFMDDDVMLNASSLIRLYRNFGDGMTALAAAPHLARDADGKRYPALIGTFFLRKKLFRKGGYVCKGAVLGRYPDRYKGAVPTEWAMGYFFAVRRDLLERFGIWFDEKLISYAYGEDLDFSYAFIKMAHKEGYKAMLDPDIYVNHLGSKEWRIPSQKATYMYVINRYYLSCKHFKPLYMRFLLAWSDVGKCFERLIGGQNSMDIIKPHIMCIKKLHLLNQGIIDKELQDMVR